MAVGTADLFFKKVAKIKSIKKSVKIKMLDLIYIV